MISTIIDATTFDATDAGHHEDIMRVLRVMLRPLEHDIQRAEVLLFTAGESQTCRIYISFIDGEPVIVERAAKSGRDAFRAATDAAWDAIKSRPAPPLRRWRHLPARPVRGRRGARQASNQQRIGPEPARHARVERDHQAGHRVLVALPQLAYPRLHSPRSRLLQAVLGTDLHVLKVLGGPPSSPKEGRRERPDGERLLCAEHETRAWYRAMLGAEPPATHVRVRIGEFVCEVAARAARVDPAIIVLPDTGVEMGGAAVALARGAFRPVLVARSLVSGSTLLAALDLDDEHHPVLEAAELLAAELAAPVVALYNDDSEGETSKPAAHGARSTSCGTVPTPRRARTGGVTMLLTREDDGARAIVREASAHDVDTILIGARPPSLFERLESQDFIADVVDSTDRSVLILPLAASEHSDEFSSTRNVLH